jgi:hypothetical protein
VNTADDIKRLADHYGWFDGCAAEGAAAPELLEALRELTTLDGIRIKYSTSRPDSPRHPLWEQYLQDVAGFHERLEHAWHFARAAIKKCEEPK